MRLFEAVVGEDQAGQMVKDVLAPLHLGKRLRRRLTLEQGVRLNGAPIYWTSRVCVRDILTVDLESETTATVEPEPLPLTVVYEDEHVLVVHKPTGMVVHPTGRTRTGTLAAAVLHHWQDAGEQARFRPLHRLDRDTSGLIVIAKHKWAHERLERDLRARRLTREYMAFAHGAPLFKRLTINEPIGLAPGERLRRSVISAGRPAVTHIEEVQVFAKSNACRFKIRLETGRTHQIRVHAAHIGHPLIGDWLYGLDDHAWDREYRVALHAFRLAFAHPITNEIVDLTVDLPTDLADLESRLRGGMEERNPSARRPRPSR